MKILITGGAGFIGSAFVRMMMASTEHRVLNVDKLTYAGNLENLAEVAEGERYRFLRADICEGEAMEAAFAEYQPEAVVHFAAESHVDRSILSPEPVVATNFMGSFRLLEAARRHGVKRYVHVSTDEVYGSIAEPHDADEDWPLVASSPYSASKAGSDLLALSYWKTYGMPVMVTRASNNYGPYQFPEKLIPLMISNALEDQPLPIYGDGMQVRDWLYVDDHCRAIQAVLESGRAGEVYNVGGSRALANVEVVKRILAITGKPESLMVRVKDRPGHDRRYAITSEKVERETGWRARVEFEKGLEETVRWYSENREWVARVKSGAYREYYEKNYGQR
ncbi:MAG: dTDP-glucose 4,6-dehydratase [Acidobacteriota bacterium]|jgi:dTDP-glucose 4,6-dehydratase